APHPPGAAPRGARARACRTACAVRAARAARARDHRAASAGRVAAARVPQAAAHAASAEARAAPGVIQSRHRPIWRRDMKRIRVLGLLMPLAASASPRSVPPEAVAHYKRGRELQDAQRWDEAITEYRAAQAIAPRPGLLFDIGQCLRGKGDAAAALEMYEE